MDIHEIQGRGRAASAPGRPAGRRLGPLVLALLVAQGLATSAGAAALMTPEEGESQVFALLNRGREVKLRPHALLCALADWQAGTNARRRAIGELDDLGRDFRARCRAAGLVDGTSACSTADEFYFRTVTPNGDSLLFDPMAEEARKRWYDAVGIRCVEGDDGLFYWCITFLRSEPLALFAARGPLEPASFAPTALAHPEGPRVATAGRA